MISVIGIDDERSFFKDVAIMNKDDLPIEETKNPHDKISIKFVNEICFVHLI